MGMFTYNVNDPHDKPEDIIEAARKIQTPDIVQAHDYAKKMRQFNWDSRRISTNGTFQGGNSEYQWVAHIPRKVADLLDMRHPGWDTDEKMLRRILQAYPECHVAPEEMTK